MGLLPHPLCRLDRGTQASDLQEPSREFWYGTSAHGQGRRLTGPLVTAQGQVFTDVMGRRQKHTIVVDWDGTCVEAKWPDMGDWLPGAKAALRQFHDKGCRVVIFSARLSPFDPWSSQRRSAAVVQTEFLKVRDMLDRAGLTFVDIWMTEGKPGGSVYIDDRAERYHGRPGSWTKLAQKVLMRLDLTEPELPVFDQDVANGD